MADQLKTSLVLTADGGQLKAVLQSASSDVKALGDTAKAASADLNTAAGQIDAVTASAKAVAQQTGKATESVAGLGSAANAASATAGKAATAITGFFNLNRAGMAELRAAAVNSVQALAAGINPLMVLQTEGAQVLGAFVQGGKITLGTFAGVAAGAAVAAAAIGSVAVAYEKGAAEAAAFNRAVALTGNAAGVTAGALENIVSSATAAGNIGPAAARSIATQMVATGQISSQVIGRLVDVTADYAAATGKSAEEAGQALTAAFSDPSKALKDLNGAYNLLSDAQAQNIKDLIAQGDKTKAALQLTDALGSRVRNLADQDLGWLQQAWRGIESAASDAWDKMKGIGRGETLEEQLAEAKRALAGAGTGSRFAFGSGLTKEQAQANVDRLQGQVDAQNAAAQSDADAAKLREESKALGDLARGFASTSEQAREYQNEMVRVQNAITLADAAMAALGSGGGKGAKDALSGQIAAWQELLKTITSAQEALRTPLQASNAQLAIARQVAAAKPADRPALQAFLTTQDQAKHSTNKDERAAADQLAANAAAKAILDQTTAINDQNAAIDLNTKLTIAEGDAWKVSAAEGAAADAARLAAVKALSAPIDQTAEKMRQLAAAAADAALKGAQQLQQVTQQANSQEVIADASLQGIVQQHQAELNAKVADATKSLNDSLANAKGQAAADLKDEIAGITDQVLRLDDAANKLQLGQAMQGQQDQITLLQKQLDLVDASNDARNQGLALTQAQLDLEHLHIDALSTEGQQYIANAENIAKMNAQLEKQRAIAEELPNFFDQMFDRIGSGFTDLALQTGTLSDGIHNLGAAIESEVVQEMLKLVAINPLKNLIDGDGLPTISSVVQHLTQTSAAGGSGISTAGGGGGTIGYVGGSSSVFSQLFSGSGASGGLGTLLFGSAGARNNAFASGMSPATSGLFGSNLGLASFFNSGVGTGLIGAALSTGLSLASGQSLTSSLFSGGGSLLGGIVGSIIPGVGTVAGTAIGGILGSIFGGLFGHHKKPPKLKSITDIDVSNGLFDLGDTTTSHIGDYTSGLGQSAVGGLNQFLASVGAQVTGPLSGLNQLLYYGRTPRYMSTVGGVTDQFGNDQQGAEDAVNDFIARTIIAAVKQNKLAGVSDAVATAIKNSGATDLDTLQAAVTFGQFYDELDQIRTPAQAATKALNDLNAKMAASAQQAEQYGLDAAKIPQIYADDFNNQVKDAIEQLQDPTQYALDQLDLQKAADIAQAQKLGADVNAVEQEYALKRQQIVEQGLAGVNSTFQDFFNSLVTGDLSALAPAEQLKQAQTAYDAAVASGSADEFTAAAQTLLQVASQFYASSQGYADIYKKVVTDTKNLGKLDVDLPAFAAGGWHAGGLRLVGENGPEIEATGPARYWDADTTAKLLSGMGADFDPKTQARYLETLGRNGDTDIVHVNKSEIGALYAMGGAGTVNPYTGWLEFYINSGGINGSMQGGVGSNSTPGSHGGIGKSGGNGGGGGGDGAGHYDKQGNLVGGPNPSVRNQTTGKVETAAQASADPNSVRAAHDGTAAHNAASMGNSTTADYQKAQDYNTTPANYDAAVRAYADRIDDYNDRANTTGEDVGNFLASLAGFNEIAPSFDVNNLNPNADWGWDPAGLIGTVVGAAAGLPFGGGFIADQISKALGRPLEVNLGPSVFGAPDTAISAQASSLAASNDNLSTSGINSNLNAVRAAGLSTSSPIGMGGADLSSGSDFDAPARNLVEATKANSANIAALHGQLGAIAQTNQQMLAEMKKLRQSNESLANWTKNVQSRQGKAA